MKRKNPIALIAGWVGLFLAPGPVALGADTGQSSGAVAGRVSNLGTGVYLEGARVVLLPSGVSTLTAQEGRYHFPQIPAGEHTLSVSYTGLETQSVSVSVQSGRTTARDVALTADVYVLDKFVVPGEREGNARAITLQRNAPNVKNVIAADAFGMIADENIGNFLQRLSGVAMSEQEGSLLFIKIRGMDSSLNAVTLDGTRQPGGGTRGGLGRGFELDTVPAEFIETIEVTKSPTPDMDADSIGGSVNLKTKSALDRKGRIFTYRMGGSYTMDGNNWGPLGNFMYSDRVGKDQRLGVMITGSYDDTERARNVSLIDWELTGAMDRPVYFYLTSHGEDAFTHTRGGLGVRLDYKINETTTVFANTMYSYYADTMHRRRAVFDQVQTRVATSVVNGVGRDATNQIANILPGFTGPPGSGTITETINHRFLFDQTWRERDKKTWNFQVGGTKRFADGELDISANYAPAKGWQELYQAQPGVTGVGFRFDHSDERLGEVATWKQISGRDIRDPANWTLPNLSINRDSQRDEIFGAQLNFRKSFNLAAPAYIKTGLRYRSQDPRQYFDRWGNSYVGPNLAKFAAAGSAAAINPDLVFMDIKMAAAELDSNPQNFRPNLVSLLTNQLNNDKRASESVGAAYFMGGVQIDKLGILAGVRIEETHVKGQGNVADLTDAERARRATWVGPVTEEENLRRIQAERGNFRRSSASYKNVFPGIHFRYEPRAGVVARASYSTGIGRPNFSTIIPGDSVSHESQLVTANNTALKPQRADNFDVSLEYYYEPAGLISASVFLKEISDFIFTADVGPIRAGDDNGFGGDYVGYDLRTQRNGGWGRVRGLELNYQQRFSMLPGFWSGFGVFANHTWLESIGDYGIIGQVQTQAQLAGFVPRTASWGISYIRGPWTIRALTTYVGKSPQAIQANPFSQRINRSRLPTDFSVSYQFNPRLTLFMNVNNVFAQQMVGSYVYHPSRTRNKDGWQQHIKFGVSGRL
jgi:iron complex outermembrane receptor protein